MRGLRDGKLVNTSEGQIEYVPFERSVSKEVFQEMEIVLAGLESGEIETKIPFEKP